jgi:myo-inositol catabolism protein IolS
LSSDIAGARYPEQALDNALAAQIKLSAAEVAEIDVIGRIVTDHLDNSQIMWE